MERRRVWATVIGCGLFVAYQLFVLSSNDSLGQAEGIKVVSGSDILIWPLVLGALAAFGVALVLLLKRQWIGILPLVLSLISPVTFAVLSLPNFADYHVLADWQDDRGADYVLLWDEGLQDNDMLLTRRSSKSDPDFKVLDKSEMDEESGLRLVRPVGSESEDPILFAKGKLLVGACGKYAFVSYDRSSGESTEMRSISPFLLLRPNDKPNEDDFKELLNPKTKGRPTADAVRPELHNPNPRVRQMANELLRSLKV